LKRAHGDVLARPVEDFGRAQLGGAGKYGEDSLSSLPDRLRVRLDLLETLHL
jgi:hypothetical protein